MWIGERGFPTDETDAQQMKQIKQMFRQQDNNILKQQRGSMNRATTCRQERIIV
jgi:hypothetical protein